MPLPPKPPALDVPTFAAPALPLPSPEPLVPGAHVLSSDAEFWELHQEMRTLGRGSFGEVRLVRVRSTGALVAVKMVTKSSAPANESYGGAMMDARKEPNILLQVQRKFDSAPARIGGRRKQHTSVMPQMSLCDLQDAIHAPAPAVAASLSTPLSLRQARPQTLPVRRRKDRERSGTMSVWELREALGAQPGGVAAAEPEAAQLKAHGKRRVPSICEASSGVVANEAAMAVATAEEGDEDDAVRLLEVYDSPATLFMVMRAELGGDLQSRLASLPGGVCGEAEAKAHAAAILRALDGMHAQGVVHRDIKPANVLLNEHNEGRLGDFGLAEMLPEGGAGLLTSVCGTHDCMAPEMVRCGHGEVAGYGCAVDLWAVGLTLFTMLCGYHPFQRATEIATLTAILDADFSFPHAPDLSEPAKDLIRRLLVPQPEHRATAAEGLRHAWLCADDTASTSRPPPEPEAAAVEATLATRQLSRLLRPSVVKSTMAIALGRQVVGHT